MKRIRIFLTGGSGFIGRNIIEILGQKYDIFAPAHTELELLDATAVRNFIQKNRVDIIIHAAGRGDRREKKDMPDPIGYNVRLFFNVARNKHFVKKIIHLGSGAEYGKQKNLTRVKEDYFDKYVPEDAYGFAKYVCSNYTENCDNIINLRLFGVYGKYENYTYKFISNAVVKNLFSLPITIFQNARFDYIFIDDLVKIIEFFISHKSKHRTYNCTSGKTIDLISLATIINKISDKPSKIIILNQGLNKEYSGHNSRLLNELKGFKFTSHQDAISLLYQYCKSILGTVKIKEIKKDEYIQHCKFNNQNFLTMHWNGAD